MTARLVRTVALFLLLSLTLTAAQKDPSNVPLRPIAPLDLARVLDSYAAGQFDDAVLAVARAGDDAGRNLRRHWEVTGQQWIDADPARRPQRLLVAAALALETEDIRAERGDWRTTDRPPCAAACVLDWAQLQLTRRGEPDRAEHAWYLAAAALAGGVRDWRYLQQAVVPSRASRITPGLLNRALKRFPGDAALRLEQAIAAASRFSITADGATRNRNSTLPLTFLGGRDDLRNLVITRLGTPESAAAMLADVATDPVAGAEARLRLGYLHWAEGRDDAARSELAEAVAQASEADVRYLAQFLLGSIALRGGDAVSAIPWLEAALATRPASQSAAVALASLELQRGNADRAHEIARRSLDERRADADPWRLFLYGHHPELRARIAELRRQVKP